ncbi:hypothetical protein [Pelagicoccus sp. SDUM812002]|uniref:hypothetical protein n=1 Tax=Pelagicoccus sp. SDUM812002 TaxID=3041266 RepID=UPI00280FA67F|nr:hypothetical protein [Pelagicoccus sp. SDUM812002]MDQ8188197.1 hypothetical protein [Pelagicoccus sp. SDUM812002]
MGKAFLLIEALQENGAGYSEQDKRSYYAYDAAFLFGGFEEHCFSDLLEYS